MRVMLVHNPNSGDSDHEREQLVSMLTRAGHRVEYHSSKGPWQTALSGRPDLVAVAGGDGTVGEVARAVTGSGTPIAILPMGTANNIARFLGLTDIPSPELVAGWNRASLCPFDFGVARGPWGSSMFLESIGLGVLADLMHEIDAGGSGYVNQIDDRSERIDAAIEVLQQIVRDASPLPCEIMLDERDYSGEYLLVEVLNFGAAGPNLRLAPDADGGDGVLDVVLVPAQERRWLENHLAALRGGRKPIAPHRAHHGRRVTIRCAGARLHLDDELWAAMVDAPSETRVEAVVQTHALTFVVPDRVRRRGAS